DLGGHHVVPVQGDPETVESGTEVRAGSRDLDGDRGVDEAHAIPAASAAACTSASITVSTTEPMWASGVSMSFNPCPVTVTVIVAPAGTSPASPAASRPATPAAEPGSTKTPS